MSEIETSHDRVWRRWGLPVLMFLVLASLVVGDDLRQRKALRDTCADVNSGRALQNISNEKTRGFLMLAANARWRSSLTETGEKRHLDRATSRLYHDLAISYPHVPLRPCPALLPWQHETPPPPEPKVKLPHLPT